MHQVHGATVVRVAEPGGGAGLEADAAVTAASGAVLAVQVADCAPVALVGSNGVVGDRARRVAGPRRRHAHRDARRDGQLPK